MTRSRIRLLLSVATAVAAVAAALLIRFDDVLSAGVAAVIAVGCIAEAWRRDA